MTTQTSKRERLVACAKELFRAEGFHATGIDRIIEQAGVAKMTLYNNFGSKDQLIAEVVDQSSRSAIESMRKWIATSTDPFEQIMLLFDGLCAVFEDPDQCGCLVQAASAEFSDPNSVVVAAIREHQARVHQFLIEIAIEAECVSPESLASQIALLMSGTQCAARVRRDASSAEEGKRAAAILLEHACA